MRMRNGHEQPQLPPWVACTIHKVCRVIVNLGSAQPYEGYVQSIGAGFVELVQRVRIPLHNMAPGDDGNDIWKFTPIFLHVAHICSIAPVEAQWQPPRLAVVEKPKLVVP